MASIANYRLSNVQTLNTMVGRRFPALQKPYLWTLPIAAFSQRERLSSFLTSWVLPIFALYKGNYNVLFFFFPFLTSCSLLVSCLALFLWDYSIPLHEVVVCLFLLVHNTLLYEYVSTHLSLLLLREKSIFSQSIFSLGATKNESGLLLWTFFTYTLVNANMHLVHNAKWFSKIDPVHTPQTE